MNKNKVVAILCAAFLFVGTMTACQAPWDKQEASSLPAAVSVAPTATPAPTAVCNAVISWVDIRNTIYVGETMTFQVDLQGYDGMDAYLTWQYKLNDQDWRDLDAHGLTLVYKVQESGTLSIRLRIETP